MNEVENTARLLSNKPLLATGRWCWLGLHRWTKYTETTTRKEGVYQVDYQTRHCDHCHTLEIKELRRF